MLLCDVKSHATLRDVLLCDVKSHTTLRDVLLRDVKSHTTLRDVLLCDVKSHTTLRDVLLCDVKSHTTLHDVLFCDVKSLEYSEGCFPTSCDKKGTVQPTNSIYKNTLITSNETIYTQYAQQGCAPTYVLSIF